MSAPMRTSACVDCATPIIGDRLRCPACHAAHAEAVASVPLPVPDGSRTSLSGGLLAWVVFGEVLVMVLCGLVLAAKGCST